jgi:predicted TIM-barrel fold metal-dependent hydrolase
LPTEKWKSIEPYWNKSFNTSYNRVLLSSIKNLYGIDGLNASTVDTISSFMKTAYKGNWFNHVLRNMCKIDWLIQDDEELGDKRTYVRYSGRFTDYLGIKSKFAIDSIAVSQVDPIYSLADLVKSMEEQFEEKVADGMVVVKVAIAYKRTLFFENVKEDAAKKVFSKIISGNEDFKLTFAEAKPLQDYLMYKILDLARKHKLPVAFHTGFLAGRNTIIGNTDPELLTNLFLKYPDVRFVLFHGSFPYGGTISALAKNFPNVYIDMNWIFAISPAYTARYLNEWLEMVPASKIFAFGGDQRTVENTYGQMLTAKKVISDVLIEKVRAGYLSISEAKQVAKMILHDNAVEFYNLH